MDINSKALHIFKGFIDDLIKVFPEYKIPLYENYSDILALETLKINENQKIKDFLKKIDSVSTEITDKNECIFENDLFLLEDVCFKKIWSSNISDKTKETIWKYLQSFCLINININTLEKLNGDDNLSDQKMTKKSKKDLENYQKINEDFTSNKPSNEDLNGFNSILENTNIGKIAKEITEELGIVVIPLNVHCGEDVFKDGVDIFPDEFYPRLEKSVELPKTSQPSIGDFINIYKRIFNLYKKLK